MTAIETNARFLLLAMLAEIEVFAEIPDAAFDDTDPFLLVMCRDGVPFDPALWVGERLSPARRMAFSRAARRLTQRGQVVRVTERGRDRVRCLVPTPAGLVHALSLADGKADRGALGEGLRRTRWGRKLVQRLANAR